MGELEKEKTMKELEMRDALSQHRGELAARDALVQGLRDRDHENRATIDLQRKVRGSRLFIVIHFTLEFGNSVLSGGSQRRVLSFGYQDRKIIYSPVERGKD